jgi:hypothetical protein
VKILIFLLVLANLLFYAFSTGLIGAGGSDESGRIGQQLHPDKVRIVASGDPPAPVSTEETPADAPTDVEPEPAAKNATAPAAQTCLRWTSLSRVEAERVGRVVSGGFADFSVTRNVSVEGGGWWVHIPPQSSREAADKKARELKALGVSDYFILQEGALRHAISLGIFSSEKAAQDHLAKLQSQGVRSARAGMRPDKDGNLQLEVRGPEERKVLLLSALAEALPKNPPKDCQ